MLSCWPALFCIFILGTSDPYVKFKLEGKQLYKSKVVYKSLNPRWNESFSYPLRDREHIVEVRVGVFWTQVQIFSRYWSCFFNGFLILLQVYDKNRTADEFMGSSTISLKNLELYKWGIRFLLYFRECFCGSNKDVFKPFPSLHRTYEMELRLDDAKSKEDDMGVILVDVCLMFRDATIKRGPVRVFVIWEIFIDIILCAVFLVCTDPHVSFSFFPKEMGTTEK